MNVFGCGIDIEEPSRFSKHIPKKDVIPVFCSMIFTEDEIGRNRKISPELTFPLAFSCKEAVFKALGRSWSNSDISWKDIELIFKDERNLNDFEVRLSGYAKVLLEEKSCKEVRASFDISPDYVIFEVLLM